MTPKILIDINVALDVIQNRGKDYAGSAQVLSFCENGGAEGFLSAASFGVLYYILAKDIGKKKALTALKKLRSFLKVAALDEMAIDLALNSEITDFEDALQHSSALQTNLTHIVTRNRRDFVKASLTVVLPEEFLATNLAI